VSDGHPVTILIIEDDIDVREVYREVLEDAGYRAVVAANGKTALDWLRAAPGLPAAIVLDVMMPVMNGHEFRAEIAKDEALRGIPVIVVTAHREETGIECVAQLYKPVSLDDLLSTVARACASVRTGGA
jgi:CheY-like chemotaxis protein